MERCKLLCTGRRVSICTFALVKQANCVRSAFCVSICTFVLVKLSKGSKLSTCKLRGQVLKVLSCPFAFGSGPLLGSRSGRRRGRSGRQLCLQVQHVSDLKLLVYEALSY